MFEASQEAKSTSSTGLWLGLAILAVAIGVGAYFFMGSKANRSMSAASPSAAAQAKEPADAVKDLKIQRTTMNKDRNDTAVWVVTIENKSDSYIYKNIQYETTYVGADNNALLINKGTIPDTFAPGDQKNAEIKDVPYPAGTAWYKLKITGATATAP